MEKRRMKTTKIVAFATGLLFVLMMAAPTFAVKGPLTDHLQYKFYGNQAALFTGLINNEIDLMAWPLTYTQYQQVTAPPSPGNITVAPYYDLGDYEIAFNNNFTDPSHTADRKAMNYTEFRQAMACLIDKDGLIAGPAVNGFGTRIDTNVARPVLDNWVNFNFSKYASDGTLLNNYPWDYNVTHALEILWNNNWYDHGTYPSVQALVAALPLPAGSVHYPPDHPRAGTAIDYIVAYVRSDHASRKTAGEALVSEMQSIGIGVTLNEGASKVCYTPVFINHDYDFYTAGWSFGVHPLHWYSMCTPMGIYPGGPNLYMIDDANLTYHATMEYPNATSAAMSVNEAMICQEILVKQAMLVPLYSSASYMAYRTGVVGVINFRGYGLTTALDYTFLNAKVPPYSHPMTIRYGTMNPPLSINPIFSSWTWDYEVADRIFTSYMNINPYKPTVIGKSPAGGDLPWMAYDWKYETDSGTGNAIVTLWFWNNTYWHDGVKFTVDDLNYTIFLGQVYGDSWGHSDFIHVKDFQKIDDWTCKIYFDFPAFWSLYTTTYDIVPMHIYKYIAIPPDAPTGNSLTGHHGEWPGRDSLDSEILPGAPFTYAQLTGAGGEQYVWIGTNMWKYVPGTYVTGVTGGLMLDAYPDFFLPHVLGEMDFNYYWYPGQPPQWGCFKIDYYSDYVMWANASGTNGTGWPVPFRLGGLHVWEPGCDVSPPAGIVGTSDMITMALAIGSRWNYFGVTTNLRADVNIDGKVGLRDLVLLANAYGSVPGDPNWNPNADIDFNGVVGLNDLVIMAQEYGNHFP
jgi:hypothetical protein